MQLESNTKPEIAIKVPEQSKPFSFTENDHSQLLSDHNLEYKIEDHYLQVGEINWTQGWIIDLSVIFPQIPRFLNILLPYLIKETLSFKIAKNSRIAESISSGELGALLLGKTVSIFPVNNIQALKTAQELIRLTASFRGPKVLTDRHLGSVVYTRYGACKGVVSTNTLGREEIYIYNSAGALIQDPYDIPFRLLNWVSWPFSVIATAVAPKLETVLQDKYKPIKYLKTDIRGSVRKGLYLEKWYRIKWCVIKEGRENMVSDNHERDLSDRLRWQYELHKHLEGILPLPKVYDLFVENGDTYLVMEYIKGSSMISIVSNLFMERIWTALPLEDRLRLLSLAINALKIIEQLHLEGYLHRDITPANFLVDKKDRLYMIDLELSYSETLNKPHPPFRLGTPGFMSPEQETHQGASVKQDIYAIGGLLLNMLTSLPPDKFALNNKSILVEQLSFFLSDDDWIHTLSNCFDNNPSIRPTLSEVHKALIVFKENQRKVDPRRACPASNDSGSDKFLSTAIQQGLEALGGKKMKNAAHLWVSKATNEFDLSNQRLSSYTVYSNISNGLSGVIWLLSRAQKLGFNLDSCSESVEKSLTFIKTDISSRVAEIPANLYYGTTGIGVGLVEGIENGLIVVDSEIRAEIKSYLFREDIEDLGIITGISGQGMGLLKAASFLGEDAIHRFLQTKLDRLLSLQQKDGSWAIPYNSKKSYKLTGLGYGTAGILLFLLEYCKRFKHYDTTIVKQSATNALQWLVQQSIRRDNKTIWYVHDKTKSFLSNLQDGIGGIVLSLIKGYEFFGDPTYRRLAEECLESFPSDCISPDTKLSSGLVGYAENCLEAALVFQSHDCQERANRAVQFLLHCCRQEKDGTRYWLVEGTKPTAGLMDGNAGILHFLLRCYRPKDLSHPLLA